MKYTLAGKGVQLSQSPDDLNKEGVRFDQGKNRLDLFPFDGLEALGDVFTYGADKYADRNWEKGMAWGRILGSLLRHTFKFWMGETFDKESGCHHMAHATWNALALLTYDLRKVGTDDRPLQTLVNGAGASPVRSRPTEGTGQSIDVGQSEDESVVKGARAN